MRIKLDENLGARGAQLLEAGGCDVATVLAEGLCSSSDETLIEVCRGEKRALVSLDKDFSSILGFPPHRYAGIVVLRLSEPLTPAAIEDALRRFLEAAAGQDLTGRLWIVDAIGFASSRGRSRHDTIEAPHEVITPREDVRVIRPLDGSEFSVHLNQVPATIR